MSAISFNSLKGCCFAQEVPGWNLQLAPHTRCARRKKKANHFRLRSGSFNTGTYEICLRHRKTTSAPAGQKLKRWHTEFQWVQSRVLPRRSQQHGTLARFRPWTGSCRDQGTEQKFQGQGRGEEPGWWDPAGRSSMSSGWSTPTRGPETKNFENTLLHIFK